MFETIGEALSLALAWDNFLYMVLGVVVGVAFGAIPGLSGILAISLLLPFTFFLRPVAAMSLLLGAYKGSMFGGSISAITFGVPGDAPAAATQLDGYPMTKQGKPYKALSTALYSSIAGNWIADLVVIFTFVPLGILALKFGPRELFALMLVAITTLTVFVQTGFCKAILGAMIGFFLASIGLDPIMAYPRFTFGLRELETGISLVPFVVGLFALSELLVQFTGAFDRKIKEARPELSELRKMLGQRSPEDRLPIREWLSYWRETAIGSGLGVFLGALPGPGATMSAFTAHGLAGRLSKNKGKIGTGIPEGIAAAESGNSATVGPTLIPLFAFGIPGSGIAGLFVGAFMLQGITPGPGLFTDYADVMTAVFIMMLFGTLANLVISKFLMIPVFSRLGLIEAKLLVPVLMPLLILGMYAISHNPAHIIIMAGAGLLGLALRHFQVPLAPTVVAFMIGPMFEKHFRRGLIISTSWTYWFSSPIAIGLYIAAFVVVLFMLFGRGRKG
ncbi:tripartite tricarboxylate transporter permease [Chloroflexota bacterium]